MTVVFEAVRGISIGWRRAVDDLQWIEQWYAAQCDGDWEHQLGVKIETLDNPGWLLTVDLLGTNLAGRGSGSVKVSGDPPREENGNIGGSVWIDCRVRAGKFIGAGDAGQLRALLAIFRGWAGEGDGQTPRGSEVMKGSRKNPRK